MEPDGHEAFAVRWHGREIEVSYQANWLNSGQWHLELLSVDPLPVTTMGYRSVFVSVDAIEDATDVGGYILACLDSAAEDPAWRRFLEESRQLKLF